MASFTAVNGLKQSSPDWDGTTSTPVDVSSDEDHNDAAAGAVLDAFTSTQTSTTSKRRATITSPGKHTKKKTTMVTKKKATTTATTKAKAVADDKKEKKRAKRLTWTKDQVKYIFKCLLRIKEKGEQPEGGFKIAQWNAIAVNLRKKYSDLKARRIDGGQVRSKYDAIKKPYPIFKRHQNHCSGWTIIDELPCHDDADFVREHGEEHPDCQPWLYEVPPYFTQCDELLGGRMATGAHARLPGDPSSDLEVESNIDDEDEPPLLSDVSSVVDKSDASGDEDEDTDGEDDDSVPVPPKTPAKGNGKASVKGQKSLDSLHRSTAGKNTKGAARVAAAVESGSGALASSFREFSVAYLAQRTSASKTRDYVEEAMTVVSKMKLPMADKAYILEVFDEKVSRAFLSLETAEDRQEWIEMKLEQRQNTLLPFGGVAMLNGGGVGGYN